VTFFPSKDFQSPKSSILGVITGSFVKPFTPVAKKRYATIGKTKVRKELYFFHYT
jgi:Flp pilus assembly secretin CpaC